VRAFNVPIEDAQLLRRLIARRCIYGVDLNALSIELARLSIWIHTFVPGLPLMVSTTTSCMATRSLVLALSAKPVLGSRYTPPRGFRRMSTICSGKLSSRFEVRYQPDDWDKEKHQSGAKADVPQWTIR
jgi:hypothetical protein